MQQHIYVKEFEKFQNIMYAIRINELDFLRNNYFYLYNRSYISSTVLLRLPWFSLLSKYGRQATGTLEVGENDVSLSYKNL